MTKQINDALAALTAAVAAAPKAAACGGKDFVTLTRVFVYDAEKKKSMREQTITVRVSSIDSVRASNRLSKLLGRDALRDEPAHRSTITLRGGNEIEVSEISSAVLKAIGA